MHGTCYDRSGAYILLNLGPGRKSIT